MKGLTCRRIADNLPGAVRYVSEDDEKHVYLYPGFDLGGIDEKVT